MVCKVNIGKKERTKFICSTGFVYEVYQVWFIGITNHIVLLKKHRTISSSLLGKTMEERDGLLKLQPLFFYSDCIKQ